MKKSFGDNGKGVAPFTMKAIEQRVNQISAMFSDGELIPDDAMMLKKIWGFYQREKEISKQNKATLKGLWNSGAGR